MPIDEGAAQKILDALRGQRINPNDRELLFERVQEQMDDLGLDGDDEALVQAYASRVRTSLGSASSGRTERGGQRPGPQERSRPAPLDTDRSSPFRFVLLNETVATAEDEVERCGLDVPLPEGFCGKIAVTWAAETPLLIGAQRQTAGDRGAPRVRRGGGPDAPMRLGAHGPYVIPGATLRGLLRAVCEIVAHGRLWQVNRHHRYAVRDFTHPLFTEENRPTWDTLHAGWLHRRRPEDGDPPPGASEYVLTQCRKYLIRIRDLPAGLNGGRPTANGDFHRRWLDTQLRDRYCAAGQVAEGAPDFTRPGRFSLHPSRPEHVVPDPGGRIDGFFVFSGRSPTVGGRTPADRAKVEAELDAQDAQRPGEPGHHKKREYVFIDDPAQQPEPLTQDAFRRFELAHAKPASRGKAVPDGSYAVLHRTLERGGRIPVFYIGDLATQGSDFSIGLTRLFKRGHQFLVGDKLAKEAAHRISPGAPPPRDMVEALFGQVYEPGDLGKDAAVGVTPADIAWKGRVSFGFAKLRAGGARESAVVESVLMAPRASYAPFYLRGTYKDWTDADSRLAGRKRYFPQYPAGADARRAARQSVYDTLHRRRGNDNNETLSRLVFLEPAASDGELVFDGEIRLHNVSAAEIGMLLWALTLGGDPAKPYRHMIGRAKTAGAGQVRIKALRLKLSGNDAAADAHLAPPDEWELPGPGREGWTDRDGASLTPFLRAFETAMRRCDRNWPQTAPVLELLGCARPEFGRAERDAGRAEYLQLPRFRALRDAVKAGPGRPQGPDRLLGAPPLAAAQLRRPYAT